jgi:hypothetical protein
MLAAVVVVTSLRTEMMFAEFDLTVNKKACSADIAPPSYHPVDDECSTVSIVRKAVSSGNDWIEIHMHWSKTCNASQSDNFVQVCICRTYVG